MKEINISFKEIVDYIRDKDFEIESWRYKHLKEFKEKQKYKLRNEKAIKLLKEVGCYDEETKTFCDDIWEELERLDDVISDLKYEIWNSDLN